jgi:serine phosphatase RsbU (regulator of sigma subunit)
MVRGPAGGQTIPPTIALDKESAVLGRHPDCDIVLDVGAVSRQHARIVQVGEDYFVEDLNSRNGTFVNDERIEGRRRLADGDELRICDLAFAFQGTTRPGVTGPEKAPPHPGAMLVDDERATGSSTIMSRLDVSTGSTGLRLTVNSEVKLKALLEIGRNLGKAVSLDQVLAKLLDNLFGIFLQADRGFIVLRDASSGRLIPKAIKHRRGDQDQPVRISRTILNGVMTTKEAVLSADAATDSRFDMAQSILDFQIHSMMCAPLLGSDSQVLGVMQIDTVDPRHHFNRDDLEVLASVACQAAVAVENTQLHEVALKEQLLISELAQAHRVQRAFLPSAPPSLQGYEFFDFYEPASQLGGDYFDYIPISGRRVAVALGDVSGKGTPAALMMAKLSAEARYCLAMEPDLSAAVARLNRMFCDGSWEGRFITLVVAVIDPAEHQVTVLNAGHMLPLLRTSTGEIQEIDPGESRLPLGIDEDVSYVPFSIALDAGASIALYTDGVTEAMNLGNELYGPARLKAAMARSAAGAAVLGHQILGDVRRFVGNCTQSDDMCVVCFGRGA